MASHSSSRFSTTLLVMISFTLLSNFSTAQINSSKNEMKETNQYYSTTDSRKLEIADSKWKNILDPEVYRIARESGTEYAFSGEYNKHSEVGEYHCRVCGNKLFNSDGKFESSCGWPAFFEPATKNAMKYIEDTSHGMNRVEVQCGRCDSHLGHIFNDGPPPTGKRYCINSKVIQFEKEKK